MPTKLKETLLATAQSVRAIAVGHLQRALFVDQTLFAEKSRCGIVKRETKRMFVISRCLAIKKKSPIKRRLILTLETMSSIVRGKVGQTATTTKVTLTTLDARFALCVFGASIVQLITWNASCQGRNLLK